MNIQTSSTSSKILPDVVTHLDVIKSFAVIMMIIDHVDQHHVDHVDQHDVDRHHVARCRSIINMVDHDDHDHVDDH